MITVNHLVKTIGTKRILEDVNINVDKGDILGFLGPNKAGKTTTMKILAGLLSQTSGEILIDGRKIPEERNEIRSKLAFIPDQPLLYDKLTGREYLNFIYSIFKLDEKFREARIESLLEKFDLAEQGDELCENYSLGMRQKLSFASAFIREPEILLVDEPMNGLDPRANKMLQDMLSDFSRKGGTVLLSTHILDIAEKICNKIVIINHGRTVAYGTIAELKKMMKIDESGELIDIFLAVTDTPK
jgi:ABC-2 type transport system ATP-binding protein